MDDNNPGLVSRLQRWASHPLSNDMNVVDLGLTTLFVTALAFLYWCGFRYISESGD